MHVVLFNMRSLFTLLSLLFSHKTAGKGFWSEMLGVGDFYYELGVQIIEVCLALKHRNGGKFNLDVFKVPVSYFQEH